MHDISTVARNESNPWHGCPSRATSHRCRRCRRCHCCHRCLSWRPSPSTISPSRGHSKRPRQQFHDCGFLEGRDQRRSKPCPCRSATPCQGRSAGRVTLARPLCAPPESVKLFCVGPLLACFTVLVDSGSQGHGRDGLSAISSEAPFLPARAWAGSRAPRRAPGQAVRQGGHTGALRAPPPQAPITVAFFASMSGRRENHPKKATAGDEHGNLHFGFGGRPVWSRVLRKKERDCGWLPYRVMKACGCTEMTGRNTAQSERPPVRCACCRRGPWVVAWAEGRGSRSSCSGQPGQPGAASRVRDPPRQQRHPSPSAPSSRAGSARVTERPDQEPLRSRLLATDACWRPSWRPLRRSGSNLTHAPTAHGERDTSQALTASLTGPHLTPFWYCVD